MDHQIWEILKHYGIPHKIISIIQKLYDGFTCQVIREETLSEPFQVTIGVRQVCLLSPLLFLRVIDWVSITVYSRPTDMQWTLTSRLEDLDFANDICSLLLSPALSCSTWKQQQSKLITTSIPRRRKQ